MSPYRQPTEATYCSGLQTLATSMFSTVIGIFASLAIVTSCAPCSGEIGKIEMPSTPCWISDSMAATDLAMSFWESSTTTLTPFCLAAYSNALDEYSFQMSLI